MPKNEEKDVEDSRSKSNEEEQLQWQHDVEFDVMSSNLADQLRKLRNYLVAVAENERDGSVEDI